MSQKYAFAHPVLSCEDSAEYERKVLRGETDAWSAMKRAGVGLANSLVSDYEEFREVPKNLRVLALIGKGNNGGDALLACGQLLADFPRASVTLFLAVAADALKPLCAKAFSQLEGRVTVHQVSESLQQEDVRDLLDDASQGHGFHICIDGLLGLSFRPPLQKPMSTIISAVNEWDNIDLRAAVDLPSGKGAVSDETIFRADFTYATGVAKQELFGESVDCGRVRYIDLGFFDGAATDVPETKEYVIKSSVLDPLRKYRPAFADKRTFGHLFVLGGSAFMPGALMMAVQAAVRSGVGLVTAFAPASIAPSLSARVPEAIWVPWPETWSGTFNHRAFSLLNSRLERADAVLLGPGMCHDRSTELLAMQVVQKVETPIILDADAVQLRVIDQISRRKPHFGPVVITPHMGEYMRVIRSNVPDHSSDTLINFCSEHRLSTVLKGPITRICDGESVLLNTVGGPMLSRGGSGDLLAGLIGGQVAQKNGPVMDAVARGVMLHGMAAEQLARKKGQVAVHTTELLDYLPEVLRS